MGLFKKKVEKIETAPTPVEEWVWVEGYKGTHKNMQCRGYQFEIGKQFDMPEGEEIELCHSGFHLCQELNNVFPFYGVGGGNRFFKVKALVRRYNKNGTYTYEHRDDKMTSKSITFVRELTADEIFQGNTVFCNNEKIQKLTLEQKELALKIGITNVLYQVDIEELVKYKGGEWIEPEKPQPEEVSEESTEEKTENE